MIIGLVKQIMILSRVGGIRRIVYLVGKGRINFSEISPVRLSNI